MSSITFDMAGKDDISELVRLRIAYMIDDFGSISEYERQCMDCWYKENTIQLIQCKNYWINAFRIDVTLW